MARRKSRSIHARIDTNAEQFARVGNPWISERDRREMQCEPASPAPKRKPKLGTGPQKGPYIESDACKLRRQQLTNLHKVLALLGGTRTVQAVEPAKYHPIRFVQALSREEADPWSDENIRSTRDRLAADYAKARADIDARRISK